MAQKRELPPEMSQEDSDLMDRWLMDRLIPGEKELSLLMRYEGRLHRHLLQLLHELEAMKARRRGESTPLLRVDAQGLADIAGVPNNRYTSPLTARLLPVICQLPGEATLGCN